MSDLVLTPIGEPDIFKDFFFGGEMEIEITCHIAQHVTNNLIFPYLIVCGKLVYKIDQSAMLLNYMDDK